MNAELDAISNSIKTRYPVLMEDGVTVKDYYFIDCAANKEIPIKGLVEVTNYMKYNKITDFALVILFSDNIIGYRLKI